MTQKIPGIYILNGEITSSGTLISESENENYKLIMDGIFFDEESDLIEADVALELIENKGIDALVKRNGHFNIALENKKSGIIELISDILATKPWYFYNNGKNIAAAPTPGFFAENNLKMELDRQAVFETVVYNYTLSNITLISEIQRNKPFFHYKISENKATFIKNHELTAPKKKKFDTKEKMAEKIFEIISRNIRNILNNKKLRTVDVQLPLTGGFDSRHILGTLLKNRKVPLVLRHINIQNIDSKPVDIIGEDLNISVKKKHVTELNFKNISKEWLIRSGGFANFHQTYLFDMLFDKPKEKMIGFDGYLMDALLGIRPLFKPVTNINDNKTVLKKTYGSFKTHRSLFKEYDLYLSECTENVTKRFADFKGNSLEKGLLQQIVTRSVKYTGSIFPVCGDSLLNFAPGACSDSLFFALNSNWKEGMYNKARYSMLKSYFPEMDKYPSIYGKKFSELNNKNSNTLTSEKIRKIFKSGLLKNIALFIPRLSHGIFEPVKEGEHYWLRRIPELRNMMNNFVKNSLLAQDLIIEQVALDRIWKDHQKGAFNAWTMMNLFSIECSYRMLVKKQSIEEIVNIFFKPKTEV